MQKQPNLAYFPQVSILLAGIQPEFRCFLTTGKPKFLRVSSRLRSLPPLRAIDFLSYLCLQDLKRYRLAERQIHCRR
jgi:hypothetical protein